MYDMLARNNGGIMKVGKPEEAVEVSCEECEQKFQWWFDPDAKAGDEEEPIVCPKCGNSDGSKLFLKIEGLRDFLEEIGTRIE